MIMKADLYNLEGKVEKQIDLPKFFNTEYKPAIIKRAVLAMRSMDRQPYGSDPLAGKRSSAHYHGYRRYRYTMMNKEMSRIPRIHGKVGYMHMRARVAPHAVKGRKAHPPKAEKIWKLKINKKELKYAIRSALAACMDKNLLEMRGHKFITSPVIFVKDMEELNKTKQIMELFKKIGISPEIERAKEKKIRAGKGKSRGRKYRNKKSVLIIVSSECNLKKACANLAGADVCTVNDINPELLAPGTQAGRLLITTEPALAKLDERFG